MSHRRPRRSGIAVLLPLAVLLGACGNPGDLESAGPATTAVGPARLWPDLPPASTPAYDYGEAETETVDGFALPRDDIRTLDPLAVLRAQAKQHPDTFTGPLALDEDTAKKITRCGSGGPDGSDGPDGSGGSDDGSGASGSDGSDGAGGAGSRGCPVLKEQYRDLTGDGRDDLIIGIRLPDDQLAVRVFTHEGDELTQIMSTSDAVTGVELAGRDLVIRAVSGIPGYEYRTVWSWDRHQEAMLPTKDEFLRVDGAGGTPKSPAPRPPTASPSPGSTP
ncbi:hypothetical protein [Streptomyces uncialis]|uniref:hypothetical protein n=1 Tax=Streptomyces uncialis TaxID=1048205 RepID=UPI00225842D1|nr:hypothetical protein [Streptomyces uncialis]MCX4660123.1 hypothetical protein [Streptomyces uncialis]